MFKCKHSKSEKRVLSMVIVARIIKNVIIIATHDPGRFPFENKQTNKQKMVNALNAAYTGCTF